MSGISAPKKLGSCIVLLTLSLAAVAAGEPWTEEGIASWYGPGFAGRPTASTEIYDPSQLTAAHKTLPLGSLVRVYNLENDRNMVVRINDRGPFVEGRVIDLSRACAEVLGCKEKGLAQVRLVLLTEPGKAPQFSKAMAKAVDNVTPDRWKLPTPTQSTELATGYYVQVGSFRDPENAQKLLQQTDELGMRAYVELDGEQHRVMVGPYTSFSHASSAQRDLERAGIDGFLRLSTR